MKTKHKQTKALISLGWVWILSVLLLRFIALNRLILLQKLLSIIFAMRQHSTQENDILPMQIKITVKIMACMGRRGERWCVERV